MGNSLPHMCHDAKITTAKKPKNMAASSCVVPMNTSDIEEASSPRKIPSCSFEEIGGKGVRVRVKIVMKKKDADQLVARLKEQGAKQRKARMGALKNELAAKDGGHGGAAASPCRDAWTPRLASIPEN